MKWSVDVDTVRELAVEGFSINNQAIEKLNSEFLFSVANFEASSQFVKPNVFANKTI